MSEYIKPAQAFKKLEAARLLQQSVYIYGATGYGKTELIRQYFKNIKHIYVPCLQNSCDLSVIPEDCTVPVVIDNVNAIEDEELRKEITALFGRKKLRLILAGRSRMPSWLTECFIRHNMLLITEEELALSAEEIDRYMRSDGIILANDELLYLRKCCEGNPIGVIYTAQQLHAGARIGKELYEQSLMAIGSYFEKTVIAAMNTELVDFLLKVSIVEDFTEELAVMITGNTAACGLIERAMDAGNFIDVKNKLYTIRFQFRDSLRKNAAKVFPLSELKNCALLAGGYYEAHNQDNKALEIYEKFGENSRIRQLLLKNSRKCPEAGYYIEMRRYYLLLSDEDINGSVYLMSAMSMLYSMLMDFEKSEYWYERLAEYRKTAKGAEQKEAISLLAYLDISLPGRGSFNILEIIKRYYNIFKDKSIPVPELSVTSNQPSLMNGGKDFCDWSRHDRAIAATAGSLLTSFLGKYGKGFVNAALAESFFEKGGDPYEIISLISKAKLEAEYGGKTELCFAANAVLIRQYMALGNAEAAEKLLDSFEKTVRAQGKFRLLPTIEAMRCRIALVEGDTETAREWMKNAPDENDVFVALERYRYLTKIRCYIAEDRPENAYFLIEAMRYYAEKCDRKYISMELAVLTAIVRFRRGEPWKEEFVSALETICSYGFIPIVAKEGAAVFPLLKECEELCAKNGNMDKKWLERIMQETGRAARSFPLYLKTNKIRVCDVSPIDSRILACLAEGLSVQKTAEALNMNFETLRSRIKDLYRRLGAKNKTEAVMLAKEMKLI